MIGCLKTFYAPMNMSAVGDIGLRLNATDALNRVQQHVVRAGRLLEEHLGCAIVAQLLMARLAF